MTVLRPVPQAFVCATSGRGVCAMVVVEPPGGAQVCWWGETCCVRATALSSTHGLSSSGRLVNMHPPSVSYLDVIEQLFRTLHTPLVPDLPWASEVGPGPIRPTPALPAQRALLARKNPVLGPNHK